MFSQLSLAQKPRKWPSHSRACFSPQGDGLQNPYLDENIQPLALAEGDIDDLAAFLASLTSADYKEQGVKELARQRDTARAFGPKPPPPKPPRP